MLATSLPFWEVPPMQQRRFPDAVPVLTDGHITLRPHAESDLPGILELGTDPEMQRWTTVPRDYDLDSATGFLRRVSEEWERADGERIWAIEFTDDDGEHHFGGNVDIRPRGDGTARIGYGLHPAARERGIMSRAVRLACGFSFEGGLDGPQIVRIHWEANVGNFTSRRVAWATGFTFHGTLPAGMSMPGTGLVDLWQASLGTDDPMEPTTPWFVPVELEMADIRLRAWRPADAGRLEAMDQPAHHMPAGAAATADTFDDWLLERESRMAAGQGIYWCIADADTDRPLGAVMLFEEGEPMGPPGAEIGYWLLPDARGRGAATTAVLAVAEHAFTRERDGGLGMHRLRAVTAADNRASIAVLTRSGFRVWGTEHETDRLPGGTWVDALHWELLGT
jgi:RimJ/RimL family protein N-acetyltransferase